MQDNSIRNKHAFDKPSMMTQLTSWMGAGLLAGLLALIVSWLNKDPQIAKELKTVSIERTEVKLPPPPPPEYEPTRNIMQTTVAAKKLSQPKPTPKLDVSRLDLSLAPSLPLANALDAISQFEVVMDTVSEVGTFEVGDLDQIPRPIFRPNPKYPSRMARLRMSGSVTILFHVNEQGKVDSASIEKASHEDFAREVRRQVDQWGFQPGLRNGTAVPYRMRQTIDFQLPKR
jgi:TonB family protein